MKMTVLVLIEMALTLLTTRGFGWPSAHHILRIAELNYSVMYFNITQNKSTRF